MLPRAEKTSAVLVDRAGDEEGASLLLEKKSVILLFGRVSGIRSDFLDIADDFWLSLLL
jgi:hypothetical protein